MSWKPEAEFECEFSQMSKINLKLLPVFPGGWSRLSLTMFPVISHVSSILPSFKKRCRWLVFRWRSPFLPLWIVQYRILPWKKEACSLSLWKTSLPYIFCSSETTDQPARPALEAASGARPAWCQARCCRFWCWLNICSLIVTPSLFSSQKWIFFFRKRSLLLLLL